MENTILNQSYLKSKGFVPDPSCPLSVNRWEKTDGANAQKSAFWVSITFTDKTGCQPAYGIINVHESTDGHISKHCSFTEETLTVNSHRPAPEQNIISKKRIPNPMTVETFERIVAELGITL